MRVFQIFAVSLSFVSVFAVFALAQSKETQSITTIKIAVIDTNTFYDTKLGIKRLVQAQNAAYIERFGKNPLIEKIENLEKEISLLTNQNQPTCEKVVELQKLKVEFENQEKAEKLLYEKRVSIVVTPVVNIISEKLKEFAKQKGYAVVVDISKENSVFVFSYENDITKDFIKFCNDYFDKENLK